MHGRINQFTRFNDLTHLVGTTVTPVASREEKRKQKQFQIFTNIGHTLVLRVEPFVDK